MYVRWGGGHLDVCNVGRQPPPPCNKVNPLVLIQRVQALQRYAGDVYIHFNNHHHPRKNTRQIAATQARADSVLQQKQQTLEGMQQTLARNTDAVEALMRSSGSDSL